MAHRVRSLALWAKGCEFKSWQTHEHYPKNEMFAFAEVGCDSDLNQLQMELWWKLTFPLKHKLNCWVRLSQAVSVNSPGCWVLALLVETLHSLTLFSVTSPSLMVTCVSLHVFMLTFNNDFMSAWQIVTSTVILTGQTGSHTLMGLATVVNKVLFHWINESY